MNVMGETEEKIKVGDWVMIIDHRLTGYTGYINKNDVEAEQYQIKVTKDKNGKNVNGRTWVEWDQVILTNELIDDVVLSALIDLALDMNDKEWFMELSAQLPLAYF